MEKSTIGASMAIAGGLVGMPVGAMLVSGIPNFAMPITWAGTACFLIGCALAYHTVSNMETVEPTPSD